MHVFRLISDSQRQLAKAIIDKAPEGYTVKIAPPKRSTEQNDYMWQLLSEVSVQKPQGRMHTPEVWKALFLSACGHQVQFEHGLDGTPFPIGFRSSRLNKAQMADLITFIIEWSERHGVVFSEKPYKGEAA